MEFGMQLCYGNTSGYFQGFLDILIFFICAVFPKKTDRNFWPRVPLERFVAPLWDLVCCFIMAIPRDIFKDFLRFWFFAVFEKKKQLAIFGPTCHLNYLSKVYETWYAASLWQLTCSLPRVEGASIIYLMESETYSIMTLESEFSAIAWDWDFFLNFRFSFEIFGVGLMKKHLYPFKKAFGKKSSPLFIFKSIDIMPKRCPSI